MSEDDRRIAVFYSLGLFTGAGFAAVLATISSSPFLAWMLAIVAGILFGVRLYLHIKIDIDGAAKRRQPEPRP